MKYLYKRSLVNTSNLSDADIEVKVFQPTLIKKLTLEGEKSFKNTVVRFLFQLMTRGRARVYYVMIKGELAHTTYVVPKCFKFPFLKKCDYEIGPCYTYPKYRGKGIYPLVLQFVCKHLQNEKSDFYMIVDENNLSSIRGIEKAGFEKCGLVKVTKFLKRYKIV